MSADAWTIVATQLVTTLGIVYFLVQRMDNLGRDLRGELGARIDGSHDELRARIDRSHDELGARIDRSHDELGARIDGLRQDLGGRIDAQTARIDAHIERHAG